MAAWSLEISNAVVMLYHHRNELSAAWLADRLAGAAIASRQLFHLSTAHHNYLEYRQRDPVGAELYKATEAVPRNTIRGPKVGAGSPALPGTRCGSTPRPPQRPEPGAAASRSRPAAVAAEAAAAKAAGAAVAAATEAAGGRTPRPLRQTRRESLALAAAAAVAATRSLAREVAEPTPKQPAAAARKAAAARQPKGFRPAAGEMASPSSAWMQEAPTGGKHSTAGGKDLTWPPGRPYAAIRRAIKEWRSLGASRWVIETILRRVQIPWRQRPPQYRSRGYQLKREDDAWAEQELQRLLAAGYLGELSPEEAAAAHCVVGAFVTHSAGKSRLVEDYRHPNAHMERRRFKYETLAELAPGLRSEDQMIS